ncbi:MAG: hypothetical protein QXK78_01615 [Candidatus Bathyarchaeia archaeon]
MAETLPGCIGYYGKPTAPNNCKTCRHAELCVHVSMRFVPKERVKEALAIIDRMEQILWRG